MIFLIYKMVLGLLPMHVISVILKSLIDESREAQQNSDNCW